MCFLSLRERHVSSQFDDFSQLIHSSFLPCTSLDRFSSICSPCAAVLPKPDGFPFSLYVEEGKRVREPEWSGGTGQNRVSDFRSCPKFAQQPKHMRECRVPDGQHVVQQSQARRDNGHAERKQARMHERKLAEQWLSHVSSDVFHDHLSSTLV